MTGPFDDEPEETADPDAEPEEDDGINRCKTCKAKQSEKFLTLCVVCKKYFCDPDSYPYGGKVFCSNTCANLFFFGEDDD